MCTPSRHCGLPADRWLFSGGRHRSSQNQCCKPYRQIWRRFQTSCTHAPGKTCKQQLCQTHSPAATSTSAAAWQGIAHTRTPRRRTRGRNSCSRASKAGWVYPQSTGFATGRACHYEGLSRLLADMLCDLTPIRACAELWQLRYNQQGIVRGVPRHSQGPCKAPGLCHAAYSERVSSQTAAEFCTAACATCPVRLFVKSRLGKKNAASAKAGRDRTRRGSRRVGRCAVRLQQRGEHDICVRYAKVSDDYEQEPTDLVIEEGQRILVIEKSSPDWYVHPHQTSTGH